MRIGAYRNKLNSELEKTGAYFYQKGEEILVEAKSGWSLSNHENAADEFKRTTRKHKKTEHAKASPKKLAETKKIIEKWAKKGVKDPQIKGRPNDMVLVEDAADEYEMAKMFQRTGRKLTKEIKDCNVPERFDTEKNVEAFLEKMRNEAYKGYNYRAPASKKVKIQFLYGALGQKVSNWVRRLSTDVEFPFQYGKTRVTGDVQYEVLKSEKDGNVITKRTSEILHGDPSLEDEQYHIRKTVVTKENGIKTVEINNTIYGGMFGDKERPVHYMSRGTYRVDSKTGEHEIADMGASIDGGKTWFPMSFNEENTFENRMKHFKSALNTKWF